MNSMVIAIADRSNALILGSRRLLYGGRSGRLAPDRSAVARGTRYLFAAAFVDPARLIAVLLGTSTRRLYP